MPHDTPMAAHEPLLLYLYYQPPHNPPPLTSSPDARQRQRRAASSRRSSQVVPLFVPSKLSDRPFLSFFLLVSFLSFFRYEGRRHPHHLWGSLHRHHRFFIVRVKSAFYHSMLTCHVPPQHLRHPFDAMLHLLPPVPSGSTILQDTGTYSITKSNDLSHTSFLIRWECYGSYSMANRLTLKTHPSPRLLEAAHSVLISHFFYHYVIINWGNTLAIVTQPIVWSVVLRPQDSH